MKLNTFVILSLIFLITSCSVIDPSGFWSDYKAANKFEENRDFGPYGGHCAIHWIKASQLFNKNEVLEFASMNDWVLVDSLIIDSVTINKWNHMDKKLFPLDHLGFSNSLFEKGGSSKFSRWIDNSSILYFFKTGFITIEPGTDNSIDVNGFVLFDKSNEEFSVYHLWGE